MQQLVSCFEFQSLLQYQCWSETICTGSQQCNESSSRSCSWKTLQTVYIREHPLYFQELCVLVSAVLGRRHLRSADQLCLVVNGCRLSSMQRRGFAVAEPLAWNDLPVAVRVSIARNRNSYRTLIKTHLFNLAIKWRSGTILEQSTRAPEKTLEGALTKQVLITYIHTYKHHQKNLSNVGSSRDHSEY